MIRHETGNKAAVGALARWLRKRHADLCAIEKEALDYMAEGKNKAYAEKMRARAENLATLLTDAMPLLQALPEKERPTFTRGLEAFSRSAATALDLDSVFYMSALLYRDEHKPGEPDNLELFIRELETH